MIALIVRRLALLVPVALVVGTMTFLLIHMTPGDPAAVMLGPEATPEQIDRLRERLGLDEPLLAQYPRWLFNVLRLDLGDSIFLNRPVTQALAERMAPTLQLTLYGLLIAVALGVPAGIFAALHQNSLIDRLLMLLATAGMAIADFFLSILLILLFAVTLRWLPSGGYVAFGDDPVQHLRSMLLPALALGISIAGAPARLIRAAMLDVLHEDYIRTAVAKGLPPGTVARRHALRNALLPTITILGYTLGDLLGGAVVVETVFSLPGMGQLAVHSIARRDFPVVQGVVMAAAAFYLLANLLVDLLYVVFDPRLRDDRR
ncbi:MAG: peptide ABC transporter [Chloroflexi bacterium]|nr:MAG: peptide ABC transporter [Chloroflexota bacterium]